MHRLCVWAVLCGVVVLNNVGKLKILHVKGFKFRLSHNNNMICGFFLNIFNISHECLRIDRNILFVISPYCERKINCKLHECA